MLVSSSRIAPSCQFMESNHNTLGCLGSHWTHLANKLTKCNPLPVLRASFGDLWYQVHLTLALFSNTPAPPTTTTIFFLHRRQYPINTGSWNKSQYTTEAGRPPTTLDIQSCWSTTRNSYFSFDVILLQNFENRKIFIPKNMIYLYFL